MVLAALGWGAACGGPAVSHQPIPVPRRAAVERGKRVPGPALGPVAAGPDHATPRAAAVGPKGKPKPAAAGGAKEAAKAPAQPKEGAKPGAAEPAKGAAKPDVKPKPGPKPTGKTGGKPKQGPKPGEKPEAKPGPTSGGKPWAGQRGKRKAQAETAGKSRESAAGTGTPKTDGEPGTGPGGPPNAAAANSGEATPPIRAATGDNAPRRSLASIQLAETAGQYRDGAPLSIGVPLARGVLEDPSLLRVWRTSDSSPLPIQTRSLSRWPDGSLRWVLVDSRLNLQSGAEENLTVGLADDIPAGADPFELRRLDGGRVLLEDGERSWPVFQPDPGGDRVAGLLARLTDRFGHEYVSRVDPDSIELLESGPLRAVVRLRGEHRALDTDGLPIAFHTFTVHLHVLPDLSTEQLEWTLENTPLLEPPGRLAFRSYVLSIDAPSDVTRLEFAGRHIPPDRPLRLAQVDGHDVFTLGGQPLSAPAPGDLWLGALSQSDSLHVHRVESMQNHPTALGWQPEGVITVGLLPRLARREYFLDDATRKTFRFDLVSGVGAAGSARMTRLSKPAHASLDPVQVAASGAWGDGGQLYVPGPADLARGANPPADAPTGWTDWGEAAGTNTHQTGSPRNRLSVFLEAVQSRRANLFSWDRSRAWHAMDLRPYHIEGFDADQYPLANLYEGVPHSNERPENRLGRSEMASRFPEYKKGLPRKGHGYNGFDPEHMTLDDVYECWLLTGDWVALSALRSAGEAMLTWKEVRPDGEIHSARTFGWTLRALIQVHRATGEARYLDAARALVHRADAERGKGKVKYLRRMPPDPRHLADRESEDPWMVAIALHGLLAYWVETADPIVPPMAADLSALCLTAYRGNGFLPDVPIDGSPVPGQVTSPLGVGSWVPGGLAAGAFITGDPRPVDAVLGYYALLKARADRPVGYGGRDWPWWQTWLVSVEQRHGRALVDHPKRAPAGSDR